MSYISEFAALYQKGYNRGYAHGSEMPEYHGDYLPEKDDTTYMQGYNEGYLQAMQDN